jgi:hypothetical protein
MDSVEISLKVMSSSENYWTLIFNTPPLLIHCWDIQMYCINTALRTTILLVPEYPKGTVEDLDGVVGLTATVTSGTNVI